MKTLISMTIHILILSLSLPSLSLPPSLPFPPPLHPLTPLSLPPSNPPFPSLHLVCFHELHRLLTVSPVLALHRSHPPTSLHLLSFLFFPFYIVHSDRLHATTTNICLQLYVGYIYILWLAGIKCERMPNSLKLIGFDGVKQVVLSWSIVTS